MQKQISFLIAMLSCSLGFGFSESEDQSLPLSSKVIINATTGYYTLADGSIWKVYSFSPRWRSLSEWWNNVKILPEAYECLPSDWFLGADVKVLSKRDNLSVNDSDAVNKEVLSRCTHLLYNTATNKYLFAVLMRPENCLIELHNDAFREGYSQGYSKGQQSKDADVTRQYEQGYDLGYHKGYQEGIKANNNNENRNDNRQRQ